MSQTDEIEELEKLLMDAVTRRDISMLELLLGDDFTLTTGRPGNEVRSRSEWLHVIRDEYTVQAYDFEELVVQDYGACAVVRSRYHQKGRMGDEDRTATYRMTDVWVQMPQGWRLQARHAQPLEADPPKSAGG